MENSVLQKRIAVACDASGDEASDVFHEVLRFLHLISLSGETLTPSRRVDDAWHEFILCTRSYAKYCQANFGRFLHHTPGGEEAENRKRFIRTLELYRQYFGAPNPSHWGPWGEDLAACGSCES